MPTNNSELGEIAPNCLYTLKRAKALLGWGSTSFRNARREGLEIRYVGRSAFVLGRDLIEFIVKNSSSTKPGATR